MVHYYSNGEGKNKIPVRVAVASPELVAARFIWKARAHCTGPDHSNLKKRFPAWDVGSAEQMSNLTLAQRARCPCEDQKEKRSCSPIEAKASSTRTAPSKVDLNVGKSWIPS